MSNHVVIDSGYWEKIMDYLQDAGAMVYEQDRLALYAQTNFNPWDPDVFLNDMAQAAAARGLTIQNCMPKARIICRLRDTTM
jgi:hypothetical protein